GRKQRERQMSKEKPETENANEQDRNGQPGAVEKSIKSTAIRANDALNKIASPLFHACAFMAGFAFTENTRAHQRRHSQRDKSGSENCHDDGDGKFLEDAAE